MHTRRLLLLCSLAGLAVACSGVGDAGSAIGAPQPLATPGTSMRPQLLAGRACADEIQAGAPVHESLIAQGCLADGREVVVRTVRCRDGRVFAIYRDLRGFVNGNWVSVGVGQATQARKFTHC